MSDFDHIMDDMSSGNKITSHDLELKNNVPIFTEIEHISIEVFRTMGLDQCVR